MTKKVKIEKADDRSTPDTASGPEETAAAPKAGAEVPPADAPEAGPGADETGAPATEGGGPSLEDLVPGIGEAFDKTPEDETAARVAELEAETGRLKDRLLRALAELENTRRRAERDRKDAETYGGTRLARDLLAVHDNLTRALAAADDEIREKHGAFIEGVELTQRELVNAFGKHRIQMISPERGEKFDPNRHQAMFEAPVPGAQNGTVIEVMQPGFLIADRLLRPAMVGVARGGQTAAPPPAEAEDGAAESDAAAEPETAADAGPGEDGRS